jgi:hypothetical protein
MRSLLRAAFVGAFLAGASTAASGQGFQRIILAACYDPNFRIDERQRSLVIPYANQAIEKYASLARESQSLDLLFEQARRNRHWSLDGVESDTRIAKDPWIGPSTRLIPIDYVRSNAGGSVLVRWNAVAGDGHLLGTYDALMVPRARSFALKELRLYSASVTVQPGPLKTYCLYPGDIEERQLKKAKREAEKAARAVRLR